MKLRNNTRQHKVIRAVHPNAGVEAWFQTQLEALLDEATRDAVLMITQAWSSAPPTVGIAMDRYVQIRVSQKRKDVPYQGWTEDGEPYTWYNSVPIEPQKTIVTLAVDAPSSTKKIDAALKLWGKKWLGKFDKLSVVVSKKFATRAFSATDVSLKAALRDAGFTVAFKSTPKALESYKLVVAENVGLIRNLHASLYNKIQQDTWASVRAGADMATLSERLHKSYGIEKKRAALIARDQNAKAKAVLETTRRQELGLRRAIWQHSSGGKEPRPLHVKWGREGAVFDLDKGMYDSDEGEWIFPGQLINCRCTSRAIIPGFDDEN